MTTPGTGSLTVAEIATRVKRQFGDEAGAQITDADIIRWVNDAMKDIAFNNDLLQVKATSDVMAGQSEYRIPLDVLTLRTCKYKGRILKAMTIQEADEYIDGHDSAPEPTGTPERYWIWANTINLYPAPTTTEPGVLMLYYTRQPVAVATTASIPEVPPNYHNRIVEYCLAQAYELDADWASYQGKMQMFQQGIDRLKDRETWQNTDVYPSITMSADEMWDGGWGFHGGW